MENLRYNIVIATDADVDGHSIIIDYFFPSVFSELIKEGHLYIAKRHCLEFVTRKKPFTVILKMNDAPPSKN
jgi:DNA gyrase/topoisomerase IV subunit B